MCYDLALFLIAVLYLYVPVALTEPVQRAFVLDCGHIRDSFVCGTESMIISSPD